MEASAHMSAAAHDSTTLLDRGRYDANNPSPACDGPHSSGGALSGHRGWRRGRLTAGFAVAALVLAGCAGAGGGGGGAGGGAISVLMVGNPQMEDIQKLTADSF